MQSKLPFHVLLKPVGTSCNLACQYCYYPQPEKHKPVTINLDLLENFTRDYIQSQPVYAKEINFVWQGGEPLIAGIAFYEAAILFQKKYAPQGIAISNSLQTNASLLNDEWCNFLKINNFIIGVSIDGTPEIHDRYRQTRGSKSHPAKGSYAAVYAGIKLLIKHKIDFNSLSVVHDGVADQALEIYDHLVEIGVQFIQFQPLMLEGSAKNTFCLSEHNWGKFLSGIYKHWLHKNHVGKIFIMNIEQGLAQYFTHISPNCVHASQCGTNLTLETKGQLYACDHLMDTKHYLGEYGHEPLSQFVNKSAAHDFGIQKSKRPECQICPVKMMCQGGCPAHLNLHNKNQLCGGYLEFFSLILDSVKSYTRDRSGFIKWSRR
ncbi:AslA-specific sulfatase-maturating enzyme [Gammaproteobacteria bacterium]|nr:AslA-specific sulfatase-maturating enzyme [Gammaproteobacteria bacterium]